MEILLSRVTQQAVQYAIRSGISITTGFAIQQCNRLLRTAPNGREREELMHLQVRLESKIRIVSPSIDMIELIAARGNTSLESALQLTRDIRHHIQQLGIRISEAANKESKHRHNGLFGKPCDETEFELRAIADDMRLLLTRIEDAVPLINLAITTCGVNLSTKLSGKISPSRLLQASTFLTSADSSYAVDPSARCQVGPTYVLTLYMLFAGHASRPANHEGIRQTTWKEVIHKARIKLWRVPLDQLHSMPGRHESSQFHSNSFLHASKRSDEFAYQLSLAEDLDDDRAHSQEDNGGSFDDLPNAGIRDIIPVHEISKIFYADTVQLLNISSDSDANTPVLLLKRDIHAEPPRRMTERCASIHSLHHASASPSIGHNMEPEFDAQMKLGSSPVTPLRVCADEDAGSQASHRLPADLDPEWMAFEVYSEEDDSEGEGVSMADGLTGPPDQGGSTPVADTVLALSSLEIRSPSPKSSPEAEDQGGGQAPCPSPLRPLCPPIKTSLSLLEMILKLAALQQFRQESHLAIEDELLNFFLEDSAIPGAEADKAQRRKIRNDAIRRVGFDPYDESPVKQYKMHSPHMHDQTSPRAARPVIQHSELAYDDSYSFTESVGRPSPSSESETGGLRTSVRDGLPSSPLAHRPCIQQTPSRSSPPGIPDNTSSPEVSTEHGAGTTILPFVKPIAKSSA